MSIEDQGFLSSDMAWWIGKHRAENCDWFNVAADLNGAAQALRLKMTPRDDDDHQSVVVTVCFLRGLSQFQGSLIMAERGMAKVAFTLVRGCFETVFFMGLHKGVPYSANSHRWHSMGWVGQMGLKCQKGNPRKCMRRA
jgi:hypothetical protein